MRCPELGCWVLFGTAQQAQRNSICSAHGHELDVTGLAEGMVTEFEAMQGWTKQKPDGLSDVQPVNGDGKRGTLRRRLLLRWLRRNSQA